ncbi:nuclear transport factor 2 family protein [Streptomyces sp. NPDC002346]
MTAPDCFRIADELEINRLNARYNWACYERDAQAYAECFTPDGVYESGNTGSRNSGHKALAAGLHAAAESAWLMGHVAADSLVDIDGDEATQRVFVLLYRRESPDGDNAFFASGWYQDSLVRTPDGWRYSHRRSYIDRSQLPWAHHAPVAR